MLALILFAEDRGHQRAVQRLTDRVLCEPTAQGPTNWITEDVVEHLRRWQGVEKGTSFTRLKSIDEIAKKHGIPRVHGHFGGEPGAADATLCRKALRVTLFLRERHALECDAVVIARDFDRARTSHGLEQARAERDWPFKVVLAGADPEVEAWLLAGFTPRDAPETKLLQDVTRRIGFDPTREPHRLRSTAASPKDAKAICRQLTRALEDRADACLEVPLDVLRTNGAECGLADFLEQIERHVVPVLRGRNRR